MISATRVSSHLAFVVAAECGSHYHVLRSSLPGSFRSTRPSNGRASGPGLNSENGPRQVDSSDVRSSWPYRRGVVWTAASRPPLANLGPPAAAASQNGTRRGLPPGHSDRGARLFHLAPLRLIICGALRQPKNGLNPLSEIKLDHSHRRKCLFHQARGVAERRDPWHRPGFGTPPAIDPVASQARPQFDWPVGL